MRKAPGLYLAPLALTVTLWSSSVAHAQSTTTPPTSQRQHMDDVIPEDSWISLAIARLYDRPD